MGTRGNTRSFYWNSLRLLLLYTKEKEETMLAKTTSCHFEGLATEPVTVETQILGGFSQFYIVGLAGTSIQ